MPSVNHNESKEPGLRMLPAASPFSLDVLWTTPNIRLLWDLWGTLIFSKVAEAEAVLLEALLWINGLLLLLFIKVPSVKDKRGCERGQHPKSRCSVLNRTDYPPRIIVGQIQPAWLSYIMKIVTK